MVGQKLHVLHDKKVLFIMVTRKLLRIIRSFEKSWITKFNSLQQQYFTALFTNMRTLKFKSRLHNCVFCCRQNTETHKMDRNPPITNYKPWPFEPVKVKFCFLRGPLRRLTAAKNAIVSWLLNFTFRMFVKSAVSQIQTDKAGKNWNTAWTTWSWIFLAGSRGYIEIKWLQNRR